MDMLERVEMIKLHVRNPVPHFDVVWRGREEDRLDSVDRREDGGGQQRRWKDDRTML